MKSILSPKMAELTDQLSNGYTQAVYTFLDKLKVNETPFIEICPMNSQYLLKYGWEIKKQKMYMYLVGTLVGTLTLINWNT